MAIFLAVLSALSYGSSDFIAGLGGRRGNSTLVAITAQPFSLGVAFLALIWFSGDPPTIAVLAWGTLAGIGSGFGGLMLYRGLAVGRMSTVASVSAIIAAVIPALVGIFLGQKLSVPVAIGIAIAIPAIGLVSWQADKAKRSGSGFAYGLVAGAGFALLYIGLDRAGTASGAWPLVPEQVAAILVMIPFVWHSISSKRLENSVVRLSVGPGIATGIVGGAANLFFLAATGSGSLASVAVISSLYPAVTIVLARIILGEHWARTQLVGLLAAGAAIALIAAG